MDMRARPYRSVLYIPGSKTRALDKARGMAVDAIIFDLEDAVSVEEKANARATLAAALSEGGYGPRMRIVRINGLDTEWGHQDARAVVEMRPDAVLLPKVNSADDLDALAEITGDLTAQKSATYSLINGYTGHSNSTVESLLDRIEARASYDGDYLYNKTLQKLIQRDLELQASAILPRNSGGAILTAQF